MNWRSPLCSLGLLLGCLFVVSARAEDVKLGAGPARPAAAGFTMSFSAPRLGNEGFHPIKIRFKPLGKQFNRQRDLTLRFRPRDQYAAELDFQFKCEVTLPQDATSFETTVLVPHFHRWQTCWVRAYEDGRPVSKLPTYLTIGTEVMDWGQHVSFGIVVPKDAKTSGLPWAVFPDVRTLVTVFGDGMIDEQPSNARFNEKQARDYLDRLNFGFARFRVLEEEELPRDWLAYSQLDVMMMPYPVFERTLANDPGVLDPLRKWIATGGELWLYAAPTEPTAAKEVFNGLRKSPNSLRYFKAAETTLSLNQENIRNPVEYESWSRSYSEGYSSSGTTRQTAYDDLVAAKHPMTATMTRKQLGQKVGVSEYGCGRVAMIAIDDPFPGSFQLWRALTNPDQQWNVRHGVDFANGNESYWGWLMAAVGGPPVTMFIVFNLIFVIVIGPLLYFTLRNKRRLYLLYFLAPVLAFFATSGLFLYAFVSDGFSNRGRIRTLTWVDARGGLDDCPIMSQSRETYYTVVDSRLGLQFDSESLVLPILYPERFNNYSYYGSNDNTPGAFLIEENASGRRYSGNFLETRTQAAYLTTRPELGKCPIEVDFSATPITVTNRWDSNFATVIVRDKKGKLWISGPISAEGTQAMQESNQATVTRLVVESEVLEPAEDTSPLPFVFRNSTSDQTATERQFEDFVTSMPSGSFLIFTDVPESNFAIRECSQEQCLRLIGGLLP
ncbi:MAG: hypothetical protein AAFU85_03615 [Planctomycetota bacterium]